MAVRYNWGRKGAIRRLLYRARRSLPKGLRLRVMKQTAHSIFARSGYEQEVPLFRSIELETRTRCNSACSFCAASILHDQRPDILMPDALYAKIIGELADLNYQGAIKFFVNNEPLLDKRLPELIRMAREQVPAARTEVHSNGLSLNPRNGRALMEAGLHLLYINNYTQEGAMHKGVKRFIDEVAPDFPDREIVFHLRLLEERLLNRGGTAPNAEAEAQPLELPCILPFDEMVLTADGRVTICCQDHYFEGAVGNANESSLKEIWYSEGFQALRADLLRSDRSKNKFCAACDFRGYKEEHLSRIESVKNRLSGSLLNEG